MDQAGRELDATATPLSTYQVGECALVLDLLGTAVRMADPATWFEPLRENLDLLTDALNATTDIGAPDQSIRVFQHADTLVVPADDPGKLIPLGKLLLTCCWNRDVLAQAAVASGGVFFITDPCGFGTRKPLQPNAAVQVLVGPAVARGHLALRGVKGPRLLLDEETVHIPPTPGVWRRYTGSAKHHVDPGAGIQVSEVAWWQDLIGLDNQVTKRAKRVEAEIGEAEREALGGPVQALWQRDITSLQKRLEHLNAFSRVLADDPY